MDKNTIQRRGDVFCLSNNESMFDMPVAAEPSSTSYSGASVKRSDLLTVPCLKNFVDGTFALLFARLMDWHFKAGSV
jgi:hypothetical protein